MSDPKNISPLLDGFRLGAPICDRNGIVCCPAIRENSNKKYIVKIISVPASQAQLDALLLAGAYKDPADAMEYFRRKGEDILKEAEHLKMLSKLEGFLPYDGWQMEPITRHRLGYEIYLVGSYKRSLAKYMGKNPFTHLEAINLGLDLCSALSVCRQSGYMYVDLKPSNIYVSEKKEYRIGDLGFLSLDSLRYASLPEQYHSPYTPPELLDPMSSMNLSVDTYAVGMILYQLYNDGRLPAKAASPDQPVPNPIHADYELAEIIMKAISPDPEQRWMDPRDLGKAIASYMQRNSVNDIPITPFIPLDVVPEEAAPAEKKRRRKKKKDAESAAEASAETREAPAEEVPTETAEEPAAEAAPAEETAADTEQTEAETSAEVTPVEEAAPEETAEEAAEALSPAGSVPAEADAEAAAETVEQTPQESEEQHTEDATEEAAEETAEKSADEAPEKNTEETVAELTRQLREDVAKIITKADDLIAHQIPEEAVYRTEPEEDPFAFALEDNDDIDNVDDINLYKDDESLKEEKEEEAAADSSKRKNTKHFADKTRGQKIRRFFATVFFVLFAAAACVGGWWFYNNVYLQNVDAMTVSGTQDQITVLVDTQVDENGLEVHCSDSKGNRFTESVRGGKATFRDLQPSTEYTLEVDHSGFYKLVGKTTEVFKTESTTQILTFEAVAGSEDGSVILEFTVEGGEPDFWNILYSAEGEDEKRETITNHTTMITGLTVGKVYTFTLDGGKNFDLSGNKQLEYMAAKLILADKMTALSDNGTDVTVQWRSPGDVVVDYWTVRCYDGYGFEEKVTVTDTKALFTSLDPAVDYIMEVTASGMTQPARLDLTADAVRVTGFTADESKKTKLNVSWNFEGTAPDKGWVLMYSIDGSGSQVVECQKAEASVTPLVPGATYSFVIQTADGRTVYNDTYTHTTVAAETFADNGMKLEDLTIGLLKTPAEEGWTCDDLQENVYTDTFAAGESASIAIRSSSVFYLPGFETKVLYVFRNSYGNVLPELVSEETYYWKNIWQPGNAQNGELNIPRLPSVPGDYVLELYFNGKTVAELDFHITA